MVVVGLTLGAAVMVVGLLFEVTVAGPEFDTLEVGLVVVVSTNVVGNVFVDDAKHWKEYGLESAVE